MTKVAIADYFELTGNDEAPVRLRGSRCPVCDEVFYPRRLVCAKCLHEGTEEILLTAEGTLYTWTWVHVPVFAKTDTRTGEYAVGQVDLPEGPRIQAILIGSPDTFSIGMRLKLDLETLHQDADGNDVVIYRFKPVGAAA